MLTAVKTVPAIYATLRFAATIRSAICGTTLLPIIRTCWALDTGVPIHRLIAHQFFEIGLEDILRDVMRRRMVGTVHSDCLWIVVHRNVAGAAQCRLDAGRSAAPTGNVSARLN